MDTPAPTTQPQQPISATSDFNAEYPQPFTGTTFYDKKKRKPRITETLKSLSKRTLFSYYKSKRFNGYGASVLRDL